MVFVLILAVAVFAIAAYGFWMAGELGMAPRWRKPSAWSGSRLDTASSRVVREHAGP